MAENEIHPSFTDTSWFDDDPRYHINKRAHIVVVFGCGTHFKQSVVAEVETKYGWTIWFNQHGRDKDTLPEITADDDWPKGWFWTFIPRKS